MFMAKCAMPENKDTAFASDAAIREATSQCGEIHSFGSEDGVKDIVFEFEFAIDRDNFVQLMQDYSTITTTVE